MAKTLLVVALLLVAVVGRSSAELSADEQKKCQAEVTKLMDCLPYAQKSTNEPAAKCCASVTDIRTADAACLCYLLAATLKGDDAVKQLNLDRSRMLSLPNVCKLQNTSISDCPAQLKLSPNSPDYALFNSSATPAPGAPPKVSTTTTTTTSAGSPSSDAYSPRSSQNSPTSGSSFAIYAVSVAVAAFFVIFLTWP
ncbi:non-specific lipid transfer protein GPI-anchored 1-like isoform X2 [Nymphaea colorata]|uniref:non-specific lipid transfer protein GPI-anchored 1-like isoform X2 n=1 Tax=Nymphaea colorata TaxID=210225 RepID=UPI00214F1E34|nr:non-specific lipid transfer protein GPI-anchored 1-like isoform X2 [Nymphaea colorata]